MGGMSKKNLFHPGKWTTAGTILNPKAPKAPDAPPPPPDEAKPILEELDRQALNRKLREGKRQGGILSFSAPSAPTTPGVADPYRGNR